MKLRFRLLILLFLLGVEVWLLYSLEGRGWNETTATLSWLRAIAIAAIPIAIAGILIFRGGRRFSLRSLLISIACVACFLAIAFLPLLEARQRRAATAMLTKAGAELESSTFANQRYFSFFNVSVERDELDSDIDPLPQWLQPIAGRLLESPMDSQIRQVKIDSDEQLSLLVINAHKFERVQTILIDGPGIQSSTLKDFSDSLPKFPALRMLAIGNVTIPDGFLSKRTGLKALFIFAQTVPTPGPRGGRLTPDQLAAIGKLTSLQILGFTNYEFTNEDLSLLGPCSSLRHFSMEGTDVTASGVEEFKSEHPDCSATLK